MRQTILYLILNLELFSNNISPIFGYISRLECRYTANFSNIYDDQYFASNVGILLPSLTRQKCGYRCIADKSCLYYNHKKDNSICELIYTFNGEVIGKPGWQYVSTDYSQPSHRGPFCKFIKPAVPNVDHKRKICVDSCSPPGYKIIDWPNIVVKAISKNRAIRQLTDGDYDTYWESGNYKSNGFDITLNKLSRVYSICVVAVYTEMYKLDKLDLEVLNSKCNGRTQCKEKQYCIQNAVQATKRRRYVCGPLTGDRIRFSRHGRKKKIRVFEVEVYAV